MLFTIAEMLYFENYDLETVITPVKVDVLDKLLQQSQYPAAKAKFLIDGFRDGFDICYRGDQFAKRTAPNLKITVGSELILWNKVMKEVKAGRYAGPFTDIPFEYYIQSPIGLVPKDKGKDTRLIFHLSYPRNTGLSVNANTPEELCKVKYHDLDKAVRLILNEIGNTPGRVIHLAKSDMARAFRNLGLKPGCFKWLLMKARNPKDGKFYWFVDKCLPFGSAVSCAVFQAFSDAVAHLVKFRTRKELVNYLDDFLFIALLKALCNGQVDIFLQICSEINFPVSLEKTIMATTCLTFLGLLLDTISQQISLPIEKVLKAKECVTKVLVRKKVTVKELQQLCGFLNFLCRAIVPGRAFTRRLYSYTKGLKLKPHHHVLVKAEMRLDLRIWLQFLQHPTVYARPFTDFSTILTADEIFLYTDSSSSVRKGMGGICYESWMFTKWDPDFIRKANPSIQYLELFAVTTAVVLWLNRFANRRIILFCDNKSVCNMINNGSSGCKNCMVLIRIITLQSLIHNSRVFAQHLFSQKNDLADALSRIQIDKFKRLVRKKRILIDREPTPIPEQLWPMEKLWLR